MKKFVASGIVTLLLATAPAYAAPAPKVGTVDLQRAVAECKEGAAARTALLKRNELLTAELKVLLAELEKGKTELEKGSANLAADERAEKTRLWQKKGREFQNRQREAQEELKQFEADQVKKVLDKFGPLLTKIGEAENFTVILDRNNGVYYSGKQADLTETLVKRADAEYEKH